MSMKRNVKVGFALEFLSFLHNNKAMMITGAIMMVLGTIVLCILRIRVIQDYIMGNISPMDARPYPVYGIISPLYAQIVFIIIAMLGLGLLVWAVTGTGWSKP